MNDARALDLIAQLLQAPDWNGADYLDQIAAWVRETGRDTATPAGDHDDSVRYHARFVARLADGCMDGADDD